MKRITFATGAAMLGLMRGVSAAGIRTALILESSVPELTDELTNYFAEIMRARGVAILDPSSVRLTYHERTSVVAIALGPLVAVSEESVAWIEERYSSPRAIFARLRLSSSSLPYGEFTVHRVQAVCSFRCMNVRSRQIIKAGNAKSERRGEELEMTQSLAANEAILAVARSSAAALL